MWICLYTVCTLSHLVDISPLPQSIVEMVIHSVLPRVQLGIETNKKSLLFETEVLFLQLQMNQSGMNPLSFLYLIHETKLRWFKFLSYQGQNTPTRGFKKWPHNIGKRMTTQLYRAPYAPEPIGRKKKKKKLLFWLRKCIPIISSGGIRLLLYNRRKVVGKHYLNLFLSFILQSSIIKDNRSL